MRACVQRRCILRWTASRWCRSAAKWQQLRWSTSTNRPFQTTCSTSPRHISSMAAACGPCRMQTTKTTTLQWPRCKSGNRSISLFVHICKSCLFAYSWPVPHQCHAERRQEHLHNLNLRFCLDLRYSEQVEFGWHLTLLTIAILHRLCFGTLIVTAAMLLHLINCWFIVIIHMLPWSILEHVWMLLVHAAFHHCSTETRLFLLILAASLRFKNLFLLEYWNTSLGSSNS